MPGESFVTWTLTPVTTHSEVRRLTGYTEIRDCPDADLAELILKAQTFVIQELSERIHNVQMWGSIDGVNTRYELPPRFHGRVLLDAQNNADEKSSVQVYLKVIASGTSPPTYSAATVSSVDALHGQVVLSAAPVAATHSAVMFTGLLVLAAVTKERFKYVVELYAAHLLDQRVRGPGKVVLSNPKAQGGGEREVRGKWLDIYERELRALRNARGRSASVKTNLPFTGDGFPPSWTW